MQRIMALEKEAIRLRSLAAHCGASNDDLKGPLDDDEEAYAPRASANADAGAGDDAGGASSSGSGEGTGGADGSGAAGTAADAAARPAPMARLTGREPPAEEAAELRAQYLALQERFLQLQVRPVTCWHLRWHTLPKRGIA